jgi:Trm5-related predicted tRNA methylase
VVALLEELRRDSPAVRDRVDKLADVMARPADPQSVIDAIKETRSEAVHVSRAAEGA